MPTRAIAAVADTTERGNVIPSSMASKQIAPLVFNRTTNCLDVYDIDSAAYISVALMAAGLRVAGGQITTATASDTVVTGLATVVAAYANLDDAPAVDPEIATASIGDQAGSPAAGSILVKTWKTLGGTPAAAAVFSKKVNWIAIGT